MGRVRFLCWWVGCLYCLPALGLVNASVQLGRRWFETRHADDSKYGWAGRESSLSVTTNPVAALPLSMGISYQIAELEPADFHQLAQSTTFEQLNTDLVGWTPVFGLWTVYLGFRQIIWAQLHARLSDPSLSVNQAVDGQQVRIGIRYHLVPLAELNVEYRQAQMRLDELEGMLDRKLHSRSFMLGLEIRK